jgi:hypothetical protein
MFKEIVSVLIAGLGGLLILAEAQPLANFSTVRAPRSVLGAEDCRTLSFYLYVYRDRLIFSPDVPDKKGMRWETR